MKRAFFGHLLRELRVASGVSLPDLARSLKVSAPYLSDVERSNRGPLKPEKIWKACAKIKCRPDLLLYKYAVHAKVFPDLDDTPVACRAVGALLTNACHLTEHDWGLINGIVEASQPLTIRLPLSSVLSHSLTADRRQTPVGTTSREVEHDCGPPVDSTAAPLHRSIHRGPRRSVSR